MNQEQGKYERVWEYGEYRKYAPGSMLVADFIKHTGVKRSHTVIDFGAGTGRGAYEIIRRTGCQVTMLDFAANCLDSAVRQTSINHISRFKFIQHDLMNPSPVTADFGYCTDVMEHIPPEHVDTVLGNILSAAKDVFFQISLQDDAFGKLIGEKLHLTVHPLLWWLKKFADLDAFVYFSEQRGQDAVIYATGQRDAKEDAKVNGINVGYPYLANNVRTNAARGLTQCTPQRKHAQALTLLAGGPSLNQFEDKIKELALPVICTNGTYNWCLERGIRPSGLIIVDAGPNTLKFLPTVIPDCRYMFASQVHPELFDKVPADQATIWHNESSPEIEAELDAVYGAEMWYSVFGGRTVTLRAMSLLRMLGWRTQHVFGLDSCLLKGEHHAYNQTENDHDALETVQVGEKKFVCTPWMAGQARDFEIQRAAQPDLALTIYGDGLIANL